MKIKEGENFQTLMLKNRNGLNSIPDAVQYLDAAVWSAEKSYGKGASTDVEANNSAVKDMRCIDLLTWIVNLGEVEALVYN